MNRKRVAGWISYFLVWILAYLALDSVWGTTLERNVVAGAVAALCLVPFSKQLSLAHIAWISAIIQFGTLVSIGAVGFLVFMNTPLGEFSTLIPEILGLALIGALATVIVIMFARKLVP